MKLTKASIFILGASIALILFWFSASFFDTGKSGISFLTVFTGFKHTQTYGYIFNFAYSLIPLFAGVYGFKISKRWGMFKSSLGKAIINLSISLFFWALGELIWAYYNFFLNSNVPYPSWADVAYVLTYPFLAAGLIYLGQAMYMKLGLRKLRGKLFVIILPIAVVASSWYFLVDIARGGSITSGGGILTVFFDVAYPTGDALILAIAFLIFGFSFFSLGGRYKWPIFFTLAGVLLEYIADFVFSYTTTINSYYNGNWGDLIYLISLVVISLGVTTFDLSDS
jgi:hypothetical protein